MLSQSIWWERKEGKGKHRGWEPNTKIFVLVGVDFFARAVGIRIGCFGGQSGFGGHIAMVEAKDASTGGGEEDVADKVRLDHMGALAEETCQSEAAYPYSLGTVTPGAVLDMLPAGWL